MQSNKRKKIVTFFLTAISLAQVTPLAQATSHRKNETRGIGSVIATVLGAVGLVGAGIASAVCAYNYSYNDLQSCITNAYQEVQQCDQFKTVLRAYNNAQQSYYSWESDIFALIKKEHLSEMVILHDSTMLRSSYPLLWYVDKLNTSINSLQDIQSKLISYQSAVEKDPHYYRNLSHEKSDAQITIDSLLHDITKLYNDLISTHEYQSEHSEHKRNADKHAVKEFAAILRKKEAAFNSIDQPLGSLHSLFDVVDQLLFGESNVAYSLNDIITGQFIRPVFFRRTTREHYPKLWFEDKLKITELEIQELQNDLQNAHARVAELSYYTTKVYLETNYRSLMDRMHNTMTMVRITREKLCLSYPYQADLRAYEDACAQERYERLEQQRLEEAEARREAQRQARLQARRQELEQLNHLERLERDRLKREREIVEHQREQEAQLRRERIRLEREREALKRRHEEEMYLRREKVKQEKARLKEELQKLKEEKRNAEYRLERAISRFEREELEHKIEKLKCKIKDNEYFARSKEEKDSVVNSGGSTVSG